MSSEGPQSPGRPDDPQLWSRVESVLDELFELDRPPTSADLDRPLRILAFSKTRLTRLRTPKRLPVSSLPRDHVSVLFTKVRGSERVAPSVLYFGETRKGRCWRLLCRKPSPVEQVRSTIVVQRSIARVETESPVLVAVMGSHRGRRRRIEFLVLSLQRSNLMLG